VKAVVEAAQHGVICGGIEVAVDIENGMGGSGVAAGGVGVLCGRELTRWVEEEENKDVRERIKAQT